MSKSLGNSVLVAEMVQRYRPIVLRYYLSAPHYRSMIEYSEEALDEAATGFERIEQFLTRAIELTGQITPTAVPAAFAAAMDDDLGVPQAVAVLHQAVRAGNTALAAGEKDVAATIVGELRAMLGVLGLDPLAEPWLEHGRSGQGGPELRTAVDGLIALTLEQRQAARERRDFAASDAIRSQLAALGITIEDTAAGPRWSLG